MGLVHKTIPNHQSENVRDPAVPCSVGANGSTLVTGPAATVTDYVWTLAPTDEAEEWGEASPADSPSVWE